MSRTNAHEQIAANLFLEAVLPAFEELPAGCAVARSLIARWRCAVEFAVRNRGAATIHFNNGKVSVWPGRDRAATLSLLFLSSRHLVRQFSGRSLAIPMLRRGFFRLGSLFRFQQFTKIFEREIEHQPRLLLRVAVGAIRSLAEHDENVREILRHAPAGVAEFAVPERDLFAWVKLENGGIESGGGRAPARPDVTIEFRNQEIALAALRGELDELAAAGAGDLRVRGLLPLAEILGVIAERANRYLPRPGRA